MNVLTHCNAGWLAFVDVAAPPRDVCAQSWEEVPRFLRETRPRSQGATLTAWELAQQKSRIKLLRTMPQVI